MVFKLTAGNINVIARNFLQTFASEQVMGWGGAWKRRQMSLAKMQGDLTSCCPCSGCTEPSGMMAWKLSH